MPQIYHLTFNADKMLSFILKVIYSRSESLERMLLIGKSLVFYVNNSKVI